MSADLYAVHVDGTASRVEPGITPDVSTTRAVVPAASEREAIAEVNAGGFAVAAKPATDTTPAELCLYGAIGDVDAKLDVQSIQFFLDANAGKPLTLNINSSGGWEGDGVMLFHAISRHNGPVTTIIDGLAGGAASIVAMAGNPCKIYENAQLFIGRSELMVSGNRAAFSEAINWLEQVDRVVARVFQYKTGRSESEILKIMSAGSSGTLLSAKDAVRLGFCDRAEPLTRNPAQRTLPTSRMTSIVRADAGPKFNVGDRVTVSDESGFTVSGVVTESTLGWQYDVLTDFMDLLLNVPQSDLKAV